MPRPSLFFNASTLMNTPTDEVLKVALAAGFDGIEPRAERLLPDREELRRTAAVTGEGEMWGLNGIMVAVDQGGSLLVDEFTRGLEERLSVCRDLKCPYLLIVPPVKAGLPFEESLRSVREGLVLARDLAARSGVRIAFEFIGVPECPVNTPRLAGEAVEGLPGIELILDGYHWFAGGDRDLSRFPVERLAMVHLNDVPDLPLNELTDAHRLLPGEGVIPLVDLLRELAGRGYKGPFSVETFNRDHWREEPGAITRRAFAAAEKLLAAAFEASS